MDNVIEKGGDVVRRHHKRTEFNAPKAIPVIQGPGLRSGTLTIVGFMPAGAFIPHAYTVPYYDTRSRKGYQRPPQEARINQLASDLRKDRTDLPTAVLLNIRDKAAREALGNGELRLDRLMHSDDDPALFYVVDGQHRILALEKLIEEDRDRWSHFMIPFVCLIGATEEEEMNQFYVVNSTAKSVKTDLALALLRRRADKDADVYVALQERGRAWQVDGQKLVERLATESSVWKQRIRLPSMEKGETTISSASMVASMKPLLSSPYFAGLKPDEQLVVIEAFWKGIRDALRPAFDDPTDYVIQKGVSVMVMHGLMPDVLERIRTRGLSTSDSSSYRAILEEPLLKIEAENGNGDIVTGLDFWASAPGGAAGSYSSSAGRRVLTAKLRQALPPVELE